MTASGDIVENDPAEPVERPPRLGSALAVWIVFGLLFAWDVYASIGNLVQVPALFESYRDFVSTSAPELAKPTPWAALIAVLVVPVIGWLAAWRLGRRRGLMGRLILFVVAWAAVSALTVSLTAYVYAVSRP